MSIRAAAETNEQKENENEESFQKLVNSHEQLNASYKKLLNDHDELQKMYLQIESDYEEIHAESSQKHSEVNRLNIELNELKEKYVTSREQLNKTEAKLKALATRKYVENGVNTIETESGCNGQKYRSRDEMEHFYESKFNELNCEISQLKEKVIFRI